MQRLKEAFKRSSGSGNQILSKSAFIQDVLCESVPPSVADWLFTACGGTSKGIAFKELVCGLVLLTKGTTDERIRWDFYLALYRPPTMVRQKISIKLVSHYLEHTDTQSALFFFHKTAWIFAKRLNLTFKWLNKFFYCPIFILHQFVWTNLARL